MIIEIKITQQNKKRGMIIMLPQVFEVLNVLFKSKKVREQVGAAILGTVVAKTLTKELRADKEERRKNRR